MEDGIPHIFDEDDCGTVYHESQKSAENGICNAECGIPPSLSTNSANIHKYLQSHKLEHYWRLVLSVVPVDTMDPMIHEAL